MLLIAQVGLVLLCLQLLLLRKHLADPRPEEAPAPEEGVSILKPLCGVDDELERNLRCFAELDYPRYELVLGVKDSSDPAYAVALKATRRWPGRVRLVLQGGTAGANPKVNQLIGLAEAARHDLLVVSDSNVRVDRDYLREIASHLADPQVGLVTHPVAALGERRLGSLLDSLHLSANIGPGMIGAKRIAGKDFVVGKSMALRRADLDRLGGFYAVRDVLAEDYVLGRRITELGKRVVFARRPVYNITVGRSLADFYRRYARWGVLHRKGVGSATYLLEPLLNPLPFALLALALHPSGAVLLAATSMVGLRITIDGAAGSWLRGVPYRARALLFVPLRDLVLLAAWFHGLCHDHVEWRSNRLLVERGTLAKAVDARPPSAPAVLLRQGRRAA
jgi:ceramide glucosyltransferase